MFNKIRRVAAATAVAILVVLTTTTAARADSALLKLVNNTSATIRFYVDGQPSCSASPGSYCNDSTDVGMHTLYSRYEDSRFEPATACEAAQYYVPPDGFTWTCG